MVIVGAALGPRPIPGRNYSSSAAFGPHLSLARSGWQALRKNEGAFPGMENKNSASCVELSAPVASSCVGANSDGVEYPTEHFRIGQDGFVISSRQRLGMHSC